MRAIIYGILSITYSKSIEGVLMSPRFIITLFFNFVCNSTHIVIIKSAKCHARPAFHLNASQKSEDTVWNSPTQDPILTNV